MAALRRCNDLLPPVFADDGVVTDRGRLAVAVYSHTFGHCLCALLIYVLWWHKPLDVNEPILRGETAQQLLAWMWIQLNKEHVGVIKRSANQRSSPGDEISTAKAVPHQRVDQELMDGVLRTSSPNEITLFPGQELLGTGIGYIPPIYQSTKPPLQVSAIEVE